MTSTHRNHITLGTAGDEQQAIGDALQLPVERPQSRFWTYATPGLVLGRGQKPAEALVGRAAAEGLEVSRRHTGGGAVIAGQWMMSQFIVLPPEHPVARMGLPDSFEYVGDAWRRALDRLGVSGRMAPRSGLRERAATFRRSDVGWVCFAGLSFGELTDENGAKLLGLAQVRRKTGIAIVCGLLLSTPPWETLVRVWLSQSDVALAKRIEAMTATCRDLAGGDWSHRPDSVASAVMEELADLDWGPPWIPAQV